jgi:hypothetical protein
VLFFYLFLICVILIVVYFFGFSVCTGRPVGYAVAQLVEALRYKPEGRGFDIFH